jgi:hypothetical protein
VRLRQLAVGCGGVLWAAGGATALDALSNVDTATTPPVAGDGLRWSGSRWVPSARGLDVGVLVPDRPDAGALVFKLVVVRAITLPAELIGYRRHAGTAATTQADLELRHNGSAIGTVRFATASSVASFIMSSPLGLAEGDRLELIASAPQGATLADVAVLPRGCLV